MGGEGGTGVHQLCLSVGRIKAIAKAGGDVGGLGPGSSAGWEVAGGDMVTAGGPLGAILPLWSIQVLLVPLPTLGMLQLGSGWEWWCCLLPVLGAALPSVGLVLALKLGGMDMMGGAASPVLTHTHTPPGPAH